MIRRLIDGLSLRARLTVWYSLVLVSVLSAFAVTVVWQQSRIGMRRVDRELDALGATLDNVFRDEISEIHDPGAAALEARATMAVPGRALAIGDANGHLLASTGSLLEQGSEPLGGGRLLERGGGRWTEQTSKGAWRIRLRRAAVGDQQFELLVAAPFDEVLRERREAIEAMWIGIPIVLLLASVGGLWLATIGLRPIARMARRATDVSPGGMDDLGESDRRDELGQLARAFNGLLARLRQTLHTQRQFMADASHELRTPVSVIQSAADVTLARDKRSVDEYREAVSIIGTEAKRLGRLVDDMLVLARADAGGYPLRCERLYLNELIAECRRTVEVLARERGVSIRTLGVDDVPFTGDENLLRRMLLNLLQNAVAYTRPGGAVTVDLSPNGRSVYIRVKDEGDGIPESDRVRIFDRFVQLDAARRGAGTGLGLPIARWIAEAHGGRLDLEDTRATGSTFVVELPVSPQLKR